MPDLERRVTTIEEHIAHITTTLDTLVTNQGRLDEALATLADAQIRTQEQFQEVNRRFAETDRRFAETDKRFAETDRRIAELVSAIGQLIQAMPRTT